VRSPSTGRLRSDLLETPFYNADLDHGQSYNDVYRSPSIGLIGNTSATPSRGLAIASTGRLRSDLLETGRSLVGKNTSPSGLPVAFDRTYWKPALGQGVKVFEEFSNTIDVYRSPSIGLIGNLAHFAGHRLGFCFGHVYRSPSIGLIGNRYGIPRYLSQLKSTGRLRSDLLETTYCQWFVWRKDGFVCLPVAFDRTYWKLPVGDCRLIPQWPSTGRLRSNLLETLCD
jgi:hypothetical protein